MVKKTPVQSRVLDKTYSTKGEAKRAAVLARKKNKDLGNTTRYEVNMTQNGDFKLKEMSYIRDKKGRLA